MIETNLLWILLVVPIAAAIAAALLGPSRTVAVRWLALAATILCAVVALALAACFAAVQATPLPAGATFEPSYITRIPVLPLGPDAAVEFYIGLDGLNVWLVVLTAFLMVPSVLVSWHSFQVQERTNEYYAWLLALETGMIGVFLSFDIILFYVFFELTLVPLFFLIGIWGGPERRYAARKFFIYTLAGSLITLLGVGNPHQRRNHGFDAGNARVSCPRVRRLQCPGWDVNRSPFQSRRQAARRSPCSRAARRRPRQRPGRRDG